jgi:hypothetical protein
MKLKKYYISAAVLLLLAGNSYAQTALPYFSGFDNAAQKDGWQVFRKGDAPVSYKWDISSTAAFSAPACLMHSYPVGGTNATDDWYVSPPFTLTAGGKVDSIRHAFAGFGQPAAGDTVAVYLLVGAADPAAATTKTLLYDYRGANYNNDNTWRLTSNLTIPATAGQCYIAFRYRTVNNWLDVRFDNVRIRSNTPPTGIGKTQANKVSVVLYPNPVTDMLHIKSEERFTETRICDISGREVYRAAFKSVIDISRLNSGIYTVQSFDEAGRYSSDVIMKK